MSFCDSQSGVMLISCWQLFVRVGMKLTTLLGERCKLAGYLWRVFGVWGNCHAVFLTDIIDMVKGLYCALLKFPVSGVCTFYLVSC